jgi:hypothetical protein
MPIQKGPANLGTGVIDATELASASVTPAKLSTGGPTWDSNSNLAVGSNAPNAWLSTAPSLQNNRSALSCLSSTNTYLSHNAYVNSSSQNIYIGTDYASLYRQNSGIHYFYTAASGTAGGVISYTKSLEVGKGATLALEGATSYSGTGISFPATQSASTDPNTLDDYEEGTWSPILGSAGATSGQTYSNQDGRYVKVGQMVLATFDLRMSAKGTLNSDILIGGLPFASRAGGYYGGGSVTNWDALATSWIYLTMRLQNNGTAVNLSGRATAGTSIGALQPADIGNSTILMGTIVYQASA